MKPWAALFNSALWPEATHMILGAFIVAGCLVATPHAWALLRGRGTRYHRTGRGVGADGGHGRGAGADRRRRLGRPARCREAADQARRDRGRHAHGEGAPLHIGGIYVDGEIKGALRIPDLLSLLAYDDPHATVQGLDAVAPPIARRSTWCARRSR